VKLVLVPEWVCSDLDQMDQIHKNTVLINLLNIQPTFSYFLQTVQHLV